MFYRTPLSREIAARISKLDLTDSGVDGGEQKNFTLGVNWYEIGRASCRERV